MPGPLQEVAGVHVVQVGQLADQVDAGAALPALDLGEIGAGDASAPGHLPQAHPTPQTAQQRAELLIARHYLAHPELYPDPGADGAAPAVHGHADGDGKAAPKEDAA